MSRLVVLTIALLTLAVSSGWAAVEFAQPDAIPREVPNQPYIHVPRDAQPRSPGMRFSTGSFFSVQVNVDSLGQNIIRDAAEMTT